MGSEQQFCLKWNNHQSTIVAGFDTLLESGTLVDCTLAAEGQYLKAHKVVLSACSPYFELLLSQHDEKHPIVILKDVKFQELKAMVDYMYHGEVNISQDQLGALLKAAESLQIKGLSDSGGGGSERENADKRHHGTRKQSIPPQPRSSPIPPHTSTLGHRRSAPQPTAPPPPIVDLPEDDSPPPSRPPPLPRVPSSREGSPSPPPKRKRHRRRSSGEDGSLSAAPVPITEGTHETSSSSELPPQSQPAPSATVPSIPSNITPVVPPSTEPAALPSSQASEQPVTETELLNLPQATEVASPRQPAREMAHEQVLEPVQKLEPPSEVIIEPKAEYVDDDVNEDSVEDLTLDDDMDDIDHARPGPSHGGEGSSSQGAGFAPWHVADQSRDEVFMAAQESVGAHRDSQDAWGSIHSTGDFSTLGLGSFIADNLPFGRTTTTHHNSADRQVSETSSTITFDSNLNPRSQQHKQQIFSDALLKADVKSCINIPEDFPKNVTETSSIKTHLEQILGQPHPGIIATSLLNQTSEPRSRGRGMHQFSPSEGPGVFSCKTCGKVYRWKRTLLYHIRFECGKEPMFQCPYCPLRSKRKGNISAHIKYLHRKP